MPRSKTRSAPMIQVGGETKQTPAVFKILEKVAVAATANGRESVAIEAIRALRDIGSVENVTITNSVFNG